MQSHVKFLLSGSAVVALLIGAQASAQDLPELPPAEAASVTAAQAQDSPSVIGAPYQVNGQTHTPQFVQRYDDVGRATVYPAASGHTQTANGEVLSTSAITGAHKTLALPTYVEVTALDTGRTILVRLNDRGPMRNDRLITLSSGAAAQLGVSDNSPVRVRKVNPSEGERAQLRRGGSVAERIKTPESLLKVLRSNLAAQTIPPVKIAAQPAPLSASEPPERSQKHPLQSSETVQPTPPVKPTSIDLPAQPKPKPAAVKKAESPVDSEKSKTTKSSEYAKPTPAPTTITKGSLMVQVGAYSSKSGADKVAKKAGGAVFKSGNIYRVRLGPYRNQSEANKGVAQVRSKGYSDARIVRAD